MAESIYEQSVALITSALASIREDGGATTWYTPQRVLEYPKLSRECLNTDHDVVYVISPGIEQVDAGTFTCDESSAAFDLSLCHRFANDSENPFDPPDTNRRVVQSRMAQDVMAALAELRRSQGELLDGRVITWIRWGTVNRTAEDTVLAEPWAIVFLGIEVGFSYTDTTP